MKRLALLASIAGFALMTTAALAQPSVEQGEAVAKKACAFCHMPREGMPAMPGMPKVPTFAELGQRGITAEQIAATIGSPPHPKPPVTPSEQEIADVAPYIQSLKSR